MLIHTFFSPWLPLWLSGWRICQRYGRPGFGPWVGKIPWGRKRLPTPVFWPGEFHGLYSPRGPKELDTAEWLSLPLFTLVFETQFCWVSSRMTVILSQHFGVKYYFTVSWFSWLKRLMSFSFMLSLWAIKKFLFVPSWDTMWISFYFSFLR